MPRTLSATGPEQGGASLLGPRPAEGEATLLPGAPPRSANTFVGRRREGNEGGAASKRRTPNSYRRTWGLAPLVRGGRGGGGSRTVSGRWKFESSRVASCPGGAKEPSAAAAMDDFAEEESCDFDLLPALSEDEVSLSGGGKTALPANRFWGWGATASRGRAEGTVQVASISFPGQWRSLSCPTKYV